MLRIVAVWVLLAFVAVIAPAYGGRVTRQNFDSVGTPYVIGDGSSPGELPAKIIAGGPTGNYLRLVDGSTGGTFNIAFDRTAPGSYRRIVAEFDFRMIPAIKGKADGIGFMLLDTATFGTTGAAPIILFEEPNLANSFGIGFDIFDNHSTDPLEPTDNHLSLHFDGVRLAAFNPGFDLANSLFNQARIEIEEVTNGSNVTVSLTPGGGPTVTPISNYFIDGFLPYESRVALGARTGAASAYHDLDNINVQFINAIPEPSTFILAATGLLPLLIYGLRRRGAIS